MAKAPASITYDRLTRALELPAFDARAAWRAMRMSPDLRRDRPPANTTFREAGVLVLVYPHAAGLTTLLMRRTPDPGVHSGQISFPGGSAEPQDADLTATALREACEEVGVCGNGVAVQGQLAEVYIPPSHFLVRPVVATLPTRPTFYPNAAEVAELIELPLANLLHPELKQETDMTLGGMTFRVPYYAVQGHVVWGATALMLAELEARLRAAR